MPGKALGCRDPPIPGQSYRGAYGSPIEQTSMPAQPLQCRGGFVSALHIKCMNMVLEGVESSLRQEELSDK